MGWDKSLKARWKFHLPELVSAIKQSVRSNFPKGSGKLAKSFSLSNTRVKNDKTVQITNQLPYAAIQNYGGYIRERTPVTARALHWKSGGKDIFATRARGFTLQGKHYLEEAIKNWAKECITIEFE